MGRTMDPKLQEALRSLETEFKRVVEYVDKEVVPATRHETRTLLRTLATTLNKAADKLEKKDPGGDQGGETK